jgi:exodeoxyribonuclease VII small subunit
MSKKSKKATFEDDLGRLEEISDLLENEDIGLEDAIKYFEEGVELSKRSLLKLNEAELKITELKKSLPGENKIDRDDADENLINDQDGEN